MASEATNPHSSSTNSPRGSRGTGRNRSRGRGRGNLGSEDEPRNRQSNGARRGRGGQRGGLGSSQALGDPTANTTMMTTSELAARFVAQVKTTTDSAAISKVERSGEAQAADDVEAEVCFICASPVVHNSVAPCNHRTCHICALRMRALYKTNDCAHCRTPAQFVVFTNNATKRYEEYNDTDIKFTDSSIGIRYENNEIMEDTVLLLRYNCPDADCDMACSSWPELHKHVRAVHHKKICDLCSRHKKVFTHEHELFTDKELHQHMRKGDDNPGAIDQSGFKGHPLCGFCAQRFYGEDELYVHCREKHERCFICDRRGGQPVYYIDYDSLEQHFRKDHFLCSYRECLEKKFAVFPSEMDMKAHQLEEHGDSLSKDVRRDARVVDLSSFDYRAPYVQERRGGGSQREQREGRGRGRGRDPNVEPLPASSAQPLRRDELAFQRQMAIHSAQSTSTRNFGGQLTPATAISTTARSSAHEPPSITVSRPSPNSEALSNVAGSSQTPHADLTPQEQARQLRHRGVIERAEILLQKDHTKLTQFRNSISSYKNGAMSPRGLIESFFALFSDTSSTALGTLIREVADLFEDKTKADALRTAWNDWRAINEDYPSLPAPSSVPSGALPLGWATVTANSSAGTSSTPTPKSTRVLKLKSSTAQSSRSSVSQTRSWGTASSLASSANPFPGLPPPSNSNNTSTKITTVPWLASASSSAPGSGPASARPTPPTSRPASRGPVRATGADAFPALPPAPKSQSAVFGFGSGVVKRNGAGNAPSGFSWGAGNGSGGMGPAQGLSSAAAVTNGEGVDDEDRGKKKGNKGKKQVLMSWG